MDKKQENLPTRNTKEPGKTSGSRVAFINLKTKHIIRIHKPHPGNELKSYQIELIFKELKDQGVLL